MTKRTVRGNPRVTVALIGTSDSDVSRLPGTASPEPVAQVN